MPVSSTTELSNLINKILTYEKYTMSDPSYLDETLLIAGWDESATSYIGKPTIQYASNYYFNSAHGINAHVFLTTGSGQTTCYNYINNVGFVNYTAHGDIQKWHDPQFTNTNVNSLTNNDKYFWAMGNCCLTANFKNAQNNQICFGETMVRVANKGAFGYIGSVPESLWYEDYYFAVGATSTFGQMPTQAQTTTGVYDAMFDDTGFNTLNAVPYIGNVAVTYAHAGNYQSSVTDEYYWRAYQCFGDGSVMPYHKVPAANNVSHNSTIFVGSTSFTVNAVAGSYVSITKNNEILGVAQVGTTGSVNVPISGLTSTGDVMVVVTRQQRQPYITTIQAIQSNGPYLALDSYTPNTALIGENTNLSLTFRNSGNAATSGTTTVTLTGGSNVTIGVGTKTFSTLAANASTTVSGFSFSLNSSATLGSDVTLHYNAVNGSNNWEGDITITADQIFNVNVAANNTSYGTVSGGGQFHYNTSCTVTATPASGYMFTSWTKNNVVVSTDAEYTFNVTSDAYLVANFAEGVVIGSGTATNNYLPSYNYYKYALTEQIYTSSELGGAGFITSIAFYNAGEAKTRTYEFYLKATSKSSFSSTTDWIAVAASDKVFSGSVTMAANDWTTIILSTPFEYDGTSNVVLVTDDNSGAYTNSPHMACRVFSASNKALYAYTDSKNYDPLSPPTSYGSSEYFAVLSEKNQLIITKQSGTMYNITAVSNPADGGSVAFGGKGDRGELVYDFEDGWQGWTAIKGTTGDSPHNWMHNTEYVAYASGSQIIPECHNSSSGMMLSESYISAATPSGSGTAVTPDNYLVSPHIKLGGSITFYAAARMSSYPAEKFSVLVSQTGNTSASNFSNTLLTVTLSDASWHEYNVDLSSYSGMGYVAIRHYDCYDQHLLYVDDITIDDGGGSTSISSYFADGNSCTVTATPDVGYSFVNWTENDVEVSQSASYTFIVHDNRNLVANFQKTFEKEITAYSGKAGWYLISSPLAGMTDPTAVDNMTNNSFDLYRFNQDADKQWENWKQEGANYHFNMEPGRGYLYANSGNVVLRFTGIPYNGDGVVSLARTGAGDCAGWNLIGNPFGDSANIGSRPFYRMNTAGDELIAATDPGIAPMEGVFVYAETNGETATFATGKDYNVGDRIFLNLSTDNGNVTDRVIINFEGEGTLPKYAMHDESPIVYFLKPDMNYAVVEGKQSDAMTVCFTTGQIGTYKLSADGDKVKMGYLHLIDNVTGDDVDLLLEDSYKFIGSSADRLDRFTLIYSYNEGDGPVHDIFAYQKGDEIVVCGNGTLKIFDILGRFVSSCEINGIQTICTPNPGFYIMSLEGKVTKMQKIIIK